MRPELITAPAWFALCQEFDTAGAALFLEGSIESPTLPFMPHPPFLVGCGRRGFGTLE